MRVVYDHQIFSRQPFGGIARYFAETAVRVAARSEYQVTVLALAYLNHYLRGAPRGVVRGAYVPHVRGTGAARLRANEVASRAWLRARSPALVHETYYAPRSVAPRGVPIVLTVYDMIHERLAAHHRADDRTATVKAAAVRRADRVICISENTRSDLLELVDVDPAKVSVVHLAHSIGAAPAETTASPRPGPPYVLYVGQRDGYKNFGGLLEALAMAPHVRGCASLVAFGGGAFTRAETARIARLGLSALVRHAGGGDHALEALYRGAAAFVYPSLYEGFGIPLLEAMAAACPVVCSATSSLPEVAGDAAEYFDPADPGTIAASLERVLLSPDRSAQLRAAGLARQRLFSWVRCADETAAVYRTLI